jgi:hypothetical protein
MCQLGFSDFKRFTNGAGWGYALFNYDKASGDFTPNGKGTECGVACHSFAKATDYVFTPYETR